MIKAENILQNRLEYFKNKDYEVILVSGKDYYEQFRKFSIPNVKIVPFL